MRNRLRAQNSFRPGFLTAVLVLAAVACFPGCDGSQRLKIGDPAPEFSSTDAHGKSVSLRQFKGSIVVLYFWTNSCCGDKLKLVEPLYRSYREKGLTLLAVDVGDSREIVRKNAQDNGLTFTMLMDQQAQVFKQYRLMGFPTIMVLDKNGIIRNVILGDIETAQLEKLVQRLLTIQKETEASYEKLHSR